MLLNITSNAWEESTKRFTCGPVADLPRLVRWGLVQSPSSPFQPFCLWFWRSCKDFLPSSPASSVPSVGPGSPREVCSQKPLLIHRAAAATLGIIPDLTRQKPIPEQAHSPKKAPTSKRRTKFYLFFLYFKLQTGRIEPNYPKVCGHQGNVLDIKWNPFIENIIASCSEDTSVSRGASGWHLPGAVQLLPLTHTPGDVGQGLPETPLGGDGSVSQEGRGGRRLMHSNRQIVPISGPSAVLNVTRHPSAALSASLAADQPFSCA